MLARSHTFVRIGLILAGYGREQGNGGTPLGSSRQGLLGAVRVRTRRLFSFLPAASLIHLRGISASAPQGDIRGRPFSPHQGNSAESDVAHRNIRFAPKSNIPEGRLLIQTRLGARCRIIGERRDAQTPNLVSWWTTRQSPMEDR